MHLREQSRERLRGIAFMMAAVFIFSIMDTLMKHLSSHYAPLEVACLRSVSSFCCVMLPIAWQGSWKNLQATTPGLHALRGILGITMLASFVFAG